MMKMLINGKYEFVESKESFSNLIEQCMGKDAKDYFDDMAARENVDVENINDLIEYLQDALLCAEEVKADLRH